MTTLQPWGGGWMWSTSSVPERPRCVSDWLGFRRFIISACAMARFRRPSTGLHEAKAAPVSGIGPMFGDGPRRQATGRLPISVRSENPQRVGRQYGASTSTTWLAVSRSLIDSASISSSGYTFCERRTPSSQRRSSQAQVVGGVHPSGFGRTYGGGRKPRGVPSLSIWAARRPRSVDLQISFRSQDLDSPRELLPPSTAPRSNATPGVPLARTQMLATARGCRDASVADRERGDS